jgi:hypothetical protein
VDTFTIKPQDLEEALRAVAGVVPLRECNPLRCCLLVSRRLQSPAFLRGEYAMLHAVHQVLEECFLAVLSQEVRCIQTISCKNFCFTNRYILSHQLLYYRYMRPDFDLSTDNLASLVGFTPRTIRRRLQDGLHFLTLDIIRREIELRTIVSGL